MSREKSKTHAELLDVDCGVWPCCSCRGPHQVIVRAETHTPRQRDPPATTGATAQHKQNHAQRKTQMTKTHTHRKASKKASKHAHTHTHVCGRPEESRQCIHVCDMCVSNSHMLLLELRALLDMLTLCLYRRMPLTASSECYSSRCN